MASIGSVTRQIAALEISNKKPTATPSSSIIKPNHTKQSSQSNVSKLLTKFAAPNPIQSSSHTNTKPLHPSSLRNQATGTTTSSKISSMTTTGQRSLKHQPSVDIGHYDGGLEIENEKRGEPVYGEAAEDLALDSSTSRYTRFLSFLQCIRILSLKRNNQENAQHVNGAYTASTWVALLAKANLVAYIWFAPSASLNTS